MKVFLEAHWELSLIGLKSFLSGRTLPIPHLFNIAEMVPWPESVFGVCLVPVSIPQLCAQWQCAVSVPWK